MLKLVWYTNRFLKDWQAGVALGPLVFIRPEYEGDAGLLAHEMEHVSQFWKRPLTHIWKYNRDPAYRLACEVEAYREQIKHGFEVWRAAHFIVHRYGLSVTVDEVWGMLR